MKRAANLPIRVKLIISHGSIAIVALFLAACGLIGIHRVTDKVDTMYHGSLVNSEAIGDLMYSTTNLQRSITAILFEGNNDAYDEFARSIEDDIATMTNATSRLHEGLTTSNNTEGLALLNEIGALIQSSGALRSQIMDYLAANKFSNAESLFEAQYSLTLDEIKVLSEELNLSIQNTATEFYDYSVGLSRFLYTLGAVLILFALVATGLATNSITNLVRTPLLQLTAASELMQQGDLSAADTITYKAKDELGTLAESLRSTMGSLSSYINEISNSLKLIADGDLTQQEKDISDFSGDFSAIKQSLLLILDRLNSTMSDIHIAAEQVTNGSAQIAAGSQTLAQGATEQASSAEELSSAVTDITNQVNKTAEHAAITMEKMSDTTNQVMVCNDQMGQMTTAMNEISQMSTEISKIVKTIEDIAFQTNILALNAAVEAARAGAAGKGFAVVADEVRNLAGKSAEASKTTSNLIGGTVDAVKRGTQILAETAQTLSTVVESTQTASELVNEIAQAANHQAQALSQVSGGVEQISHVIHTTSSTSEESAASSQELSSQAQLLKDLLDQFQLADHNY